MRMMSKRTLCLITALALCLGLSGCRTRTSGDMQGAHGGVQGEKGTAAGDASGGPLDGASPEKADSGEEADESGDESGSKTKENPEASRKEYDESARAEIVPGTDRSVYGEGEGSGAYSDSEDAQNAAAKLNDAAEQTAEQTVAAEQADKTGVSRPPIRRTGISACSCRSAWVRCLNASGSAFTGRPSRTMLRYSRPRPSTSLY